MNVGEQAARRWVVALGPDGQTSTHITTGRALIGDQRAEALPIVADHIPIHDRLAHDSVDDGITGLGGLGCRPSAHAAPRLGDLARALPIARSPVVHLWGAPARAARRAPRPVAKRYTSFPRQRRSREGVTRRCPTPVAVWADRARYR